MITGTPVTPREPLTQAATPLVTGLPAGPRSRVAGLDSIRAVAASWVVLSHLGFFPLPAFMEEAQAGPLKVVRGLYNCMWSGISAVIVFFLLSGLVIHYPQTNGSTPRWREFLARRYVRIGIPLVVVVTLARILSVHSRLDEVLWSLYAELIYYSLYPFLLALSRRIGWTPMLALSSIGYVVTVAFAAPGKNYADFPIYTQWLVGLPIWISGCILAQRVRSGRLTLLATKQIWLWRTGLYLVTFASVVANFHGGLHFVYTQNLFAILAFLWLEREIARYNAAVAARPWRVLEAVGVWSYSLYLVHNPISDLFARLSGGPARGASWFLLMASVLAGAYAFHRIVEAPSLKLSALLKRPRAAPPRSEPGLERLSSLP